MYFCEIYTKRLLLLIKNQEAGVNLLGYKVTNWLRNTKNVKVPGHGHVSQRTKMSIEQSFCVNLTERHH